VVLGGEPGQDDSGLPPANVEIPDDARELERDVIAYRRELRSRRRRELFRRVLRPFATPSTAVPVIAIVAALSLITGIMLSVLTVTPASAPTRPAPTATSRAVPSHAPRAVHSAAPSHTAAASHATPSHAAAKPKS
jgi:hypothetical protein